jgi:CheY-like chemotaxis protein
MIVDDHRLSAEMLGMLLQQFGYITALHYNASDALNILDEFRPKYIFLDLKMPGVDGIELSKKIRQNIENSEIVIIALTGVACDYDLKAINKAGFNYHLEKPIEINLLKAIMTELKDSRV